MAMTEQALDDLKTLLRKARQKDLPFGLCLGKKPEENIMVLDLKKSSEVLMRTAKAEGETSKLTHGMVGVQGKIMSLTLSGKMLPGLAKNMKVFLTKSKLKMKVVILDPDGHELESEGDEDEDDIDAAEMSAPVLDDTDADDAGQSGDETPEPQDVEDDPMAAAWSKVMAALGPRVDAFTAGSDPKAAAISKLWASGVDAAANGNYKLAIGVAEKIKPVVLAASQAGDTGQTGNHPEADPNEAKWGKVKGPIEALLLDVLKNNPPDATKLRAIWAAADEAAGSSDFAKALAIATRLKPLLDAAKSSGTSDQAQSIPKDVVAFQQSKLAWNTARGKMEQEINKLIGAIQTTCGDDDALQPIAAKASMLHEQFETLNDGLEDALDTVINAPMGPQRVDAIKHAIQAVREIESNLELPFFKDVDANNGFTSVKVTETATKSLTAIAKILEKQVQEAA